MRSLETRIPPPVIMLATASLMYLAARVLPPVTVALDVRRALAILIMACGLAVIIAAILAFRRSRTTVNPLQPEKATSLVARGVFGHSRNPMYLGMLMLLCAWAVHLGNPVCALGPVLFMLYITRFQIIPEERILQAKFGQEWDAYAGRARRWL